MAAIGALVWNVTVSLTDSQIRALPSTFIQLTPDPGTRRVLLFLSAIYTKDGDSSGDPIWQNGYQNISANSVITICYGPSANEIASSTTGATTFMASATKYALVGQNVITVSNVARATQTDYTNVLNVPFYINAFNPAGDYTPNGTTTNNRLIVTVYYGVVEIP